IKLVNINPSDIVDGKHTIVLGLIWSIILYFQIEENAHHIAKEAETPKDAVDGATPPKKKMSALEKFKGGAKKALLVWTQKRISEKIGIEIKNFGQSWRDGMAFNAVVHSIMPDVIDMESLIHKTNLKRLEEAFDAAETHLGIHRLLDPEDVDVDKPDEKSIMTYVAQFLKKYPDSESAPAPKLLAQVDQARLVAQQEKKEYGDLVAWLESVSVKLEIVDQPVQDRHREYGDYLLHENDLKSKREVYERLQMRKESNVSLTMSEENWIFLQQKWSYVTKRTRKWRWKLDSSLPGKLGYIGQWMKDADDLLEQEALVSTATEGGEKEATDVRKRLEEHEHHFQNLDKLSQDLTRIKFDGKCDGQMVPQPQLVEMSDRMDVIRTNSTSSHKKLSYTNLKFRLLQFLVVSEQKLKQWTMKYSRQSDVELLLEDYIDYVHAKQLFKEFDSVHQQIGAVAKAYQGQPGQDAAEIEKVNTFLSEVNSRWKKVSVEIRSVQTMLEEVVQYWTRYTACVDILNVWMVDAEKMLDMPQAEKSEFFQDIAKWQEKHAILNEAGNFLIEVCEETVAGEIKQQLLLINRRWKDLFDQIRVYQEQEASQMTQDQYEKGVMSIASWLNHTEALHIVDVECAIVPVKQHNQNLESKKSEESKMEDDFKQVSKIAQSLVKSSVKDVVNKMLDTLKMLKERLVNSRKDLAQAIKSFKQVLTNVESLDHGISELDSWIQSGEEMLQSHKVFDTKADTQNRLQVHKNHFSQTVQFKTKWEEISRTFQRILKLNLTNLKASEKQQQLDRLSQRFRNLLSSAREWDQKLERSLRLWQIWEEASSPLLTWLDQSESYLDAVNSDVDSKLLMQQHTTLFGTIDQNMLQQYLKTGQELANYMEEDDKVMLQKKMASVHARWKNTLFRAPMKLMQLEFKEPEQHFLMNIEHAENLLTQQEEQIERNENLQQLLKEHMEMFHQSDFLPKCNKCLKAMQGIGESLEEHSKEDRSLLDIHDRHHARLQQLLNKIEVVLVQLQQFPERWKVYNTKLTTFCTWVSDVESSVADMKRDAPSVNEYKQKADHFKQITKTVEIQTEEVQWFVSTLNELIVNVDEEEATRQQTRLDTAITNYNQVLPEVQEITRSLDRTEEGYAFCDDAKKKLDLLTASVNQLESVPDNEVDDLASAKQLLAQHQTELQKIEAEKQAMEDDIRQGKGYQQEASMPSYLTATVEQLEHTLEGATQLAHAKYQKAQVKVDLWERYEKDKSQFENHLEHIQEELEQLPSLTSHKVVQDELQKKRQLISLHDSIKPLAIQIEQLSETLKQAASDERKESIRAEISTLTDQLGRVTAQLNGRVTELEVKEENWADLHARLDDLSTTMEKKEKILHATLSSTDLPLEEKQRRVEALEEDILQQQEMMQSLNDDAKGLSHNFNSRESSPLKAKVTSLKQKYDNMCQTTEKAKSDLSKNVLHWNRYQQLNNDVSQWLGRAQTQLNEATTNPGCLDDCNLATEQHQTFLQDRDSVHATYKELLAEGSKILDQPDTSAQLQTIEENWSQMLARSNEQKLHMDKLTTLWKDYEQRRSTLETSIDELNEKLLLELRVTSPEVAVLEDEWLRYKPMQEEGSALLSTLDNLKYAGDKLTPFITPDTNTQIHQEQDELKKSCDGINLTIKTRLHTLVETLRKRKEFRSKLEEFIKWLQKLQRRLDGYTQIFGDEVNETFTKMVAMGDEFKEKRDTFDSLSADVEEQCSACHEDEANSLNKEFGEVISNYQNIDSVLQARVELCQKWSQYSTVQKGAMSRLKTLQTKVQSQEFKESDIGSVRKEIKGVYQVLNEWTEQSTELDQLMHRAQMTIKDRTTQRATTFSEEIQTVISASDALNDTINNKQTHFGQVADLWQVFTSAKDTFLLYLKDVEHRIEYCKVPETSLKSLQNTLDHLDKILKDLDAHTSELDNLMEMGQQLKQTDQSQLSYAQGCLSSIETAWEATHNQLATKQQSMTSVVSLWKHYTEMHENLEQLLNEVKEEVVSKPNCLTQDDVQKCLDKNKNGEFRLTSNVSQLESLKAKGQQITSEVESGEVQGFDKQHIHTSTQNVVLLWESTMQTISEGQKNLQSQLSLWDQIQAAGKESCDWLDITKERLTGCLDDFKDATKAESCLDKYKGELEYFETVHATYQEKVSDLEKLNNEKDIPSLHDAEQEISEKFKEVDQLATELAAKLQQYSATKSGVESEISQELEWLNELREKLAQVDTLTGDDTQLLERLDTCKSVQRELAAHEEVLTNLQGQAQHLSATYMSPDATNIAKDSSVLTKKYDTVLNRATKVEVQLQGALEQHATEARVEQQRWLTTAKERVEWCAASVGDKHALEAKLAAMEELVTVLPEGDQRTKVTKEKAEILGTAVPEERRLEVAQTKQLADDEWAAYVEQLEVTKAQLEKSKAAWTEFTDLYETLGQWLTSTEETVRQEQNLRPTLPSKLEQNQAFKKLSTIVSAHQGAVESLKEQADRLGGADSAAAHQAEHVHDRYMALVESVKVHSTKSEDNVEEHENYKESYDSCLVWVTKAQQKLQPCTSTTGDKEQIQTRLDTVKDIAKEQQIGHAKFNSAVEKGELLYPHTAQEGRDIIRQELRDLRESWEQFSDSLNECEHRLEASVVQWSSYDDNYRQLLQWMADTETSVASTLEPKATLQDKKTVLQHYVAIEQNIVSHKSLLDNIMEKSQSLTSPDAQSGVSELQEQYEALRNKCKENISTLEYNVSEHQRYNESLQEVQEWLGSEQDTLVACTDTSGDKHSLYNRLDTIQAVTTSIENGEAKLKSLENQAALIAESSNPSGQQTINKARDTLKQNLANMHGQIRESQESLNVKVSEWKEYEALFEELSKWLKVMEGQVKGQEFKATVDEKKSQVETFKNLLNTVSSRQEDFDQLSTQGQKLDRGEARQTTLTNQLNARYHTLKSNIKDAISTWEAYVESHTEYNSNYERCTHWLSDMEARIRDANSTSGDQSELVARLGHLDDVLLEKDEGASILHSAVESGEKLYPTTSVDGREAIRHALRGLRERLDAVSDSGSDVHHKLDTTLNQWTQFQEALRHFTKWLRELDLKLKQETELRANLTDKKSQMHTVKGLYRDVMSRRHSLNDLMDKVNNLVAASGEESMKDEVESIKEEYEGVCNECKMNIGSVEEAIVNHQQYITSLQDCTTFIENIKTKAIALKDTTGDKHSVQNRLERLQELESTKNNGESKLVKTKDDASKVLTETNKTGQEVIKKELENLQKDWELIEACLHETRPQLESVLQHWSSHDSKLDELNRWIRETEQKVKNVELLATIDEKEKQLENMKELQEDIISRQTAIEDFSMTSQTLIPGDSRNAAFSSQLSTRYHSLKSTIKDTVNKVQASIKDHQMYLDSYSECKECLDSLESNIENNSTLAGTLKGVQQQQEQLQGLKEQDERSVELLHRTVERGERLYSSTAAEGRETIRQQLRSLKMQSDKASDKLHTSQQQVDACAIQWATYTDSHEHFNTWLLEIKQRINSNNELKSTISEKKSQLQEQKLYYQELVSHGHSLQTLINKADTVAKLTDTVDIEPSIKAIKGEYDELVKESKLLVEVMESSCTQHQDYDNAVQNFADWIENIKEQLNPLCQTTGDNLTLQNKLDKLKDLEYSIKTGNQNLASIKSQSDKVIEKTSELGQGTISRDLAAMNTDLELCKSTCVEAQNELKNVLEDYSSYELFYEALTQWLRDMETKLKGIDMKPDLYEKQTQLDKIKVLQDDIVDKQTDFEDVVIKAHDLQGTDSRLASHTNQLNTRYQELQTNTKIAVSKWESYIKSHAAYSEAYSECSQWCSSLSGDITSCNVSTGDKNTITESQVRLQELLDEKDKGASKIQAVIEAGEGLYPSTSSDGREIVRQELRVLKEQWDALSDQALETQHALSSNLVQWSTFEETCLQFIQWQIGVSHKLPTDMDYKATLGEKSIQLQDHKIIHQDIVNHKQGLDTLNQRLHNMSTRDPSVADIVEKIQDDYRVLVEKSKAIIGTLEKSVSEHGEYHEAVKEFSEWIQELENELEGLNNTTGEKHTVQTRLDKIKSLQNQESVGNTKLDDLTELGAKVSETTSLPGIETLQSEITKLKSKMATVFDKMNSCEESIQAIVDKWQNYEDSYTKVTAWMKASEQQIKVYELKASLTEKQEQLQKLKTLKESVADYQDEIDDFMDAAHDLVEASEETRISSYIAQVSNRYQALQVHCKELILKWQGYVGEHETYEEKTEGFESWLSQARSRLEECTQDSMDRDILQEHKYTVQILLAEKDQGLQCLNELVSSGEKLYQGTSPKGREVIRHDLRSARESWDSLILKLTESQKSVDTALTELNLYIEHKAVLQQWLDDTLSQLSGELKLKHTLAEKQTQLEKHKQIVQGVVAKKRDVDLLVSETEQLSKGEEAPQMEDLVSGIREKYTQLVTIAKGQCQQVETSVTEHRTYSTTYQTTIDWLKQQQTKLNLYGETSGDRHVLQNRLGRLQGLQSTTAEGRKLLDQCCHSADVTMATTGSNGRISIQDQNSALTSDFQEFESKLGRNIQGIEDCLEKWQNYDSKYEWFAGWIKEREREAKDFSLKASLPEKEQQLTKYKALMQTVQVEQVEGDAVSDLATDIRQSTGDTRPTNYATQLVTRYQALSNTCNDVCRKCETAVNEHQLYTENYSRCNSWLEGLQERLSECQDTGCTRKQLLAHQTTLQELVDEREGGLNKLNQTTESGEQLYPNTASEGREVIRHELRSLRVAWEAFCDGLTSAQRKTEVATIQWSSADDNLQQTEKWLQSMMIKTSEEFTLKATLEEKKMQLQAYKSLQQDISAHKRALDTTSDKVQSILQTSPDPIVTERLEASKRNYDEILASCQGSVGRCNKIVAAHEQYTDLYNNCQDWFKAMKERVVLCDDITGDKLAIQSRLDRVQDLENVKTEGDAKIENICKSADDVIVDTASRGQQLIQSEVARLRQVWVDYLDNLSEVRAKLEKCASQWESWEDRQDSCTAWLRSQEAMVRDIQPQSTLAEKAAQAERINTALREMIAYGSEIDSMSENGQSLSANTSNTRVANLASQITARYHALVSSCKEQCRKQEHAVSEHEGYGRLCEAMQQSLDDLEAKLSNNTSTQGDRPAVLARLQTVQNLLSYNEEGNRKLETIREKLQSVLVNTSPSGKDTLRQEAYTLQQTLDDLMKSIQDGIDNLQTCLSQWGAYSDVSNKTETWLADIESQVAMETGSQMTLVEKQDQLERIKTLKLTLLGEKGLVDKLREKSSELQTQNSDPHLARETDLVVDRYHKALDKVEDLLRECDNAVSDHIIYQEALDNATEWIESTREKLTPLSSLEGDRHTTQAKLLKDGQNLLHTMQTWGEKTLTNSSLSGRDTIRQNLQKTHQDYETLTKRLADTKVTLESCLLEWSDYGDRTDQ
ncbi:unnamed protein product, partial [Owenia fusiformis]